MSKSCSLNGANFLKLIKVDRTIIICIQISKQRFYIIFSIISTKTTIKSQPSASKFINLKASTSPYNSIKPLYLDSAASTNPSGVFISFTKPGMSPASVKLPEYR
ncbi:hypothetical protein BpHYR1_010691 [Brachionus plicatilis]|uniref:Uncharacterized protein n=1 Tax=Brachionus plicatilis TaxID=10195 RepID=A0A3M7SVH9_BRAPC|nr:hypothetical protein BpHYR1_010691 [Brachionus plicatilis]